MSVGASMRRNQRVPQEFGKGAMFVPLPVMLRACPQEVAV